MSRQREILPSNTLSNHLIDLYLLDKDIRKAEKIFGAYRQNRVLTLSLFAVAGFLGRSFFNNAHELGVLQRPLAMLSGDIGLACACGALAASAETSGLPDAAGEMRRLEALNAHIFASGQPRIAME